MDSLEKTKQIIRSSDNILMVLPQNEEENLSSGLSLFYSLKKMGKKVNVLWQKNSREERGSFSSNKIFAIFVKDFGKDISEMCYKKDSDGLKIYLKLKEGNINEDDISFYYPQVLRPEDGYKGLSGVEEPANRIKLLSKALHKVNFNEQKMMHWVNLEEKDLEETKTSPEDLSFVMKRMREDFYSSFPLLFLWSGHRSPNFIKGVFYSQDSDSSKKILENFEGVDQRDNVMFLTREENFESAKSKIFRTI